MPGFHVEHFGCRAARADGEAVSDRLRAAGLCERQPRTADVVVVNTCSVTAEADRAARAFIRRTHRSNPEARIVVTGCYAQRAPQELAGMDGVAAVVGNSHKSLTPQIVLGLAPQVVGTEGFVRVQSLLKRDNAPGQAPIWVDDRFAHSFIEEAQLTPGVQTRPNLKIQEGCGNRCTFCVIPQTRGSSRSLPAESILKQVEGFVAAGGNELVLSGINLGRWGRDLSEQPGSSRRVTARNERAASPTKSSVPHPSAVSSRMGGKPQLSNSLVHEESLVAGNTARSSLAGLVRQIIEHTSLARLRLSSIEPMDWDEELIGLMAEFGGIRLARHAHLPLQSGSDAVLRRMHRRYRPWHYAEKVHALIQAAGPELTVGADLMVGFPGETDAEFEETLELVRALPFGYLHLFAFSPRPGTRAWALHAERPVAAATVEERMAALRALAAEKSLAHRGWFVGRELEAITLHTPAELESKGRTAALAENFLPIELEGRLAANRLVRVRVIGSNAEGVLEAALAEAALEAISKTGFERARL